MIRGLGTMAAWAFALTPLGCAQILDIDDPPPVGCQDGPAGGHPLAPTSDCAKVPSGAKAFACHDDSSDLELQKAIDDADAVLVNGTCDLGSEPLHLPSRFFLGGNATLRHRGPGYAIDSVGNQSTVTGLTLDGGGIELNLDDGTNGQNGWNITCNRFENITNGTDGVHIDNIIGKGPPSTISHNHFSNIWGYRSGYPEFPHDPPDPANAVAGFGIFFHTGLDEVTVDDNTFDEIGLDAMKGFWDGFNGKTAPFVGHHVVISNNILTRVHRFGVQFQNTGSNTDCPGGCIEGHVGSEGTVFKNNFYHHPAFSEPGLPSSTEFESAFSLQTASIDAQILNNTALADVATCAVPLGPALSDSMQGGLLQGNVIGAVPQGCADSGNESGWGDSVVTEFNPPKRFDNRYQNNVSCGPSATAITKAKSDLATGDIKEGNFSGDECSGGADLAKSAIAITFTTPSDRDLSGQGEGTWRVSVISRLSIKQVDFFLDCEASPKTSQEIQDLNPNFASTRGWLYHASIDVTKLDAGPHFITAVATDVAGVTETKDQIFNR